MSYFFSFSYFFDFLIFLIFFYFQHGRTPLHIAVQRGLEQIVQILLEKGEANVNSQKRVLFLSFSLFLKKKFVNEKNQKHKKFLKFLFFFLFLKFFLTFIIIFISKGGFTPLFFATENGNEQIVQILLDRGANVDLPTEVLF